MEWHERLWCNHWVKNKHMFSSGRHCQIFFQSDGVSLFHAGHVGEFQLLHILGNIWHYQVLKFFCKFQPFSLDMQWYSLMVLISLQLMVIILSK